jgi:SAM-dependent methyltransferase
MAEPAPSAWVQRFAPLIPAGGEVLDVASGAGRHTRWLLRRGHRVVAIDRDLAGIADLRGVDGLEALEVDLEDGTPPPFAGRRFAGVVVTRYLHRPLLPSLVAAVDVGGLLLYETYSTDQARHGRPTNPDFLLRPGELLDAVGDELRVLAYEDLELEGERLMAVQRICARRTAEEPDLTRRG